MEKYNYEVIDFSLSKCSGYGHWRVTLEIMNLEPNEDGSYHYFKISHVTTDSISVDKKDHIALMHQCLNHHYRDYDDVDTSNIKNPDNWDDTF